LRTLDRMNTRVALPPRPWLREPIPEIEQSAELLATAVAEHLADRRREAAALITKANLQSVRGWTESLWGKSSKYAPSGPYLDVPAFGVSSSARMPGLQLQRDLHRRDGYYCRFCGIPVIRKQVRQRLRKLYPELQIWGRSNQEQHAALQCMWAQYDHLIPHSRGGENTLPNLVITCAPCNYGRMQYTLEEANLSNPLDKPPRMGTWGGLEHLLFAPACAYQNAV
jgi:hypothetical protein